MFLKSCCVRKKEVGLNEQFQAFAAAQTKLKRILKIERDFRRSLLKKHHWKTACDLLNEKTRLQNILAVLSVESSFSDEEIKTAIKIMKGE